LTAVTLVYTLALAAYVLLAVRVLRRRPRTPLHWSCAAVLVALAVWSVEDIVHGMTTAPRNLAVLFGNIGSLGWVGFASVHLVFAFVLTRRFRSLLAGPLWLAVVVPPALIIYAQLTGRVTANYTLTAYGWKTVWANTGWVWFYYAYYGLYTLASLLLIFRLWRTARSYRERKQAGLILITGLITLVLGTVSDVILPQFTRLGIPDLAGAIGLIWAGGLYFAVTRYGLMSVTPQAAADEILATMPDALLLLTPEGRVATANAGATGLLRYGAGELRNLPAEKLFAAPEQFRQALARVGDEVALTAIELECRDREGRVVPVSASSRVMRDKAGETVGSVWVLRDITARRQAEERQAQLLAAVEEANQELNSFAYVVSHDLKAPLRAIDSLVKWLVDDYGGQFDDAGRELVALLLGRVRRLHDLIDGVLQYSRAGRTREEVTDVNLAAVVPNVVSALSPPDRISVAVEGGFPVVRASRVRLEQVFQNLLSNAFKYIDKPQGRVRVGCAEEDGFWKFYVKDNGPGIAEKDQKRVFQMFETLQPRDQTESTGVGLAVVKRIVEMYGGRVWIESTVGEGSSFFFTLPKPATAGKVNMSGTAVAMSGNGG